MKRIFKNTDSEVILNNIKYKKGDNKKLSSILLKEQKNFCAHTEEYIGINDAADIEHFNPNLKYLETDSYQNCFTVKHIPTNSKRTHWFETILLPTSQTVEQTFIHIDGSFLQQPENICPSTPIDSLTLNNEI